MTGITTEEIDALLAELSDDDRSGIDSHGYDARQVAVYMAAIEELTVVRLALMNSCVCGRPTLSPLCTNESSNVTEHYTAAIVHAGGDIGSTCLQGLITDEVAVPRLTRIARGVYVSGDVNVEEVSPGVTRISGS